MKILIVEDEVLAKDKLTSILMLEYPDASLDWIRSIEEGLFYFNNAPDIDVIFSDIELLDGRSFEIYSRYPPTCPIVFVTAFDTYFMEAFQTNGVAYVLKPYTPEDVKLALNKVQTLFPQFGSNQRKFFKSLQDEAHISTNLKSTFAIKSTQGSYLIQVSDIAFFQAQGDFVLCTDDSGKRHPINQTLSRVYGQLSPHFFFQINRSEIVARRIIDKYVPYRKNRLAIHLHQPLDVLYTSNSKSTPFKEWYLGK